jgi:DNA-directed RNA polymerase specialized sigma24 family protein
MNILTELKTEKNGTYQELYILCFEDVKRFITGRGGTAEDAEDIFQDSLIVLVEKLRRDDFALTASLKTYLTAIAKYIWFKQYKKGILQNNVISYVTDEMYSDISIAVENEKTFWEKIKGAMAKITNHCNQLLHDIFFKNKTGNTIQKEYGYTSLHNAQNQKYKCINQIKKALEQEKNLQAAGDNFKEIGTKEY